MGRPKKSEKHKKTPSEYPQMAFRVPGETPKKAHAAKEALEGRLDRLKKRYSGDRTPGGFVWTKNKLIVAALEIGLKALERKKR